MAVAPSPFNEIKLELAIAALLGAVLWLAEDLITADLLTQVLLLFGYAVTAAIWLVLRTRRVLRAQSLAGSEHGAQQE